MERYTFKSKIMRFFTQTSCSTVEKLTKTLEKKMTFI